MCHLLNWSEIPIRTQKLIESFLIIRFVHGIPALLHKIHHGELFYLEIVEVVHGVVQVLNNVSMAGHQSEVQCPCATYAAVT